MSSRNPRGPGRRANRGPRWDEASLFPGHHGFTWWAAVLLAVAFAVAGALVDMARMDQLGVLFQGCYFLGCLLSVLLVQRKALFGPMVQPPLILAIAVPAVVLVGAGASAGSGLVGTALAVLTPLINGFPTMAVTTLLTLLLGGFRLAIQRRPPNDARGVSPPPRQRPPGGPAQPRVSRPPRSSA